MRGVDRKTRQDRNREARRRAAEAEAAQRAALKQQRRQLDALPVLAAQIAEEEAAREAARLRKQVRVKGAVGEWARQAGHGLQPCM